MDRTVGILAVVVAVGATGCGFQMLDRWDGQVVRAAHVDAPADAVWSVVVERIDRLELPVFKLEPETHSVALSWVTAPGDGAQYLECVGTAPVGSASVMPRLMVIEQPEGGSRIEISSVVRATSGQSCRSNGRYESWLLARLKIDGDEIGPAPAAEEAIDESR